MGEAKPAATMVKFPTFRMKQSDTWLMDRLVIIERHMVTRALFDLFRKTIEETANQYVRARTPMTTHL